MCFSLHMSIIKYILLLSCEGIITLIIIRTVTYGIIEGKDELHSNYCAKSFYPVYERVTELILVCFIYYVNFQNIFLKIGVN